MRTWRTTCLQGVILPAFLLALGTSNAAAQPRSTERDVEAVREVMRKIVETINGRAFADAPRERRVEMLRQFYRADNTYARDELPVFFGPLSEPLSRGTNAYLENLNLNLEWVIKQGMIYGLRVDEMQIEADERLAVVLAHTTSGFGTADGKTTYATRGRATIVLNKMANGRWVIAHEHSELYNPENPNTPTKDKLTQELRRLKPR